MTTQLRLDGVQQLTVPAQEPTEARVAVQSGLYACKHGWATVLVRGKDGVYVACCPRCEK